MTKWQSNGKKFLQNLRKGWGHFENYEDLSMLFLQYLNWNLLAFLPALFHFKLDHYPWKKYYKGFQNSKISSTKVDFLDYFSSSSRVGGDLRKKAILWGKTFLCKFVFGVFYAGVLLIKPWPFYRIGIWKDLSLKLTVKRFQSLCHVQFPLHDENVEMGV